MIFEHPGQDLTPAECDALALTVHQDHREQELAAMQARWWDYRLLHPTVATYLFAEYYRQSCKTWHERWVDLDTAADARAFTPDDIFKSRDLTSMWLARQGVDLMGVPYDFAIEFGMRRSYNRAFPAMLRPNQMHGEEFELDLRDAWQAECTRAIRTARVDYFLAKNFKARPMQVAYREWLIEQVERRPAPRYRLLARLINEQALTEASVGAAFGEAELAQAQRYQLTLAS